MATKSQSKFTEQEREGVEQPTGSGFTERPSSF